MLKIRKANFDEFLSDVMRYNELVGPTKESKFDKLTDISQLDMALHTTFPAKKYLFEKKKVLLEFTKNNLTVPEPNHDKKFRIIMGLKRCDLNSIKRQDIMFTKETKDPYYIEERDRTVLIGYHCQEPIDEYCFCGSMELSDFYDLMLYDRDESYLVEIGSEKGKLFIDKYRKYFWDTEAFITLMDKTINTTLVLEKKELTGLQDHKLWKEEVEKCLSCGACTNLCPSCYCFDLYDEVDMKDLTSGRKIRNWASCQFQSFTKVTGPHIFRENRADRFKHRIFHQVQWFREKHGINLCTGCGRCIRGCPTAINWVTMLNRMESKNE